MVSQPTSPFAVGQVLEITFATFTPRLTIHSECQLTVEIIAGDGVGFSTLSSTRQPLFATVWSFSRGNIGSTIVHVLDLTSRRAHSAVTPAKGRVYATDGSD